MKRRTSPRRLYLTIAIAAAFAVPSLVKSDPVPKPNLPLVLYQDDVTNLPYVWSGWMGKADAIAMDDKSTTNPHTGKTCMKCEFKANDNFGGIMWMSPANDWGDVPGGQNLTGAKKLTFWARGEDGGEVVSFKFGGIGKDRPFPDSDTGELKDQKLTKDWTQYSIDLTGKDLSCIKTGFGWVVGGQGKNVVFYLDDVQYE